ncbi:cytochrome P450 3A31 [Lindgomyces ingoldianus]|uniref:Cytochrome P450 3A31 n=1 Tax=Lindgomyces ingoldianus TaxID=673940 RepID=A0ACB6R0K9_9PLEO|nr:cytochrome P450 3A31 [Lindgomyces ingoldianus]KAF2472676.1 cytochrome P450 3A31 [Lindgomyces ingoldianus]
MYLSSLLTLASGLLAIALLSYIIYQVKFHPLAKYPGPFLAKLTNAYAAYHAWKQDIHIDMWRCHRKYGAFMRYGPNTVLVNTVAGMKDIYGSGEKVIKSKSYNAMVHRTPSVLTIRDRKEHSARRRLIGQGMGDAAMRAHEPTVMRHVDALCEQLAPLDGSWSELQDMAEWSSYLLFDIMTEVVFGLKYDLIGSKAHRHVIDAIAIANIRTTILLYFPKLMWNRLDKKLLPASIAARNAFLMFMGKLLHDRYRVKPADNARDVLSALLKVRDVDTGKGLNTEQINADSTTLVIAGSDTTATALCALFFYLGRHPYAYQRARDEVRNAFTTRDMIRPGAALNSCTYLRACIDETLRLTPPIGGSLLREVAASGGISIDGHMFAPGTDVGTSIYAIHHNPNYFVRPHAFMPERWIGDDNDDKGEAETRRVQHKAMHVFSSGPRGCVGKSMALVELMLTMATVLWTMDMRPATGAAGDVGGGNPDSGVLGRHDPDEYQLFHGGITSIKKGPLLQFSRRRLGMVGVAGQP